MRYRVVLLMVFCLLARGFAQAPAPLPDAGPPKAGLTALLDRTMRGQPVVAIGMGKPDVVLPDGASGADAPLLERLQAIAEAASTDESTMIPFAVRTAWVLAPETQEVLNPELRRLTPITAQGRDELLQRLLRGLSTEQIRKLGGTGLGMADLTVEQRPMLEAALRPPLVLQRELRVPGQPVRYETLSRLEEPLDMRALRLRAHLAHAFFFVNLPNARGAIVDRSMYGGPLLAWEGWRDEGSAVVPPFVPVGNRFKPSDLDGARLTAPIGIDGVQPLSKVLAQASKVSGLRLTADLPYRNVPVFIGSAKLPAGDVLDAVRLALTATWRKLGDTYILAWEKRGLEAVQREIFEALRPFAHKEGGAWDQSVAEMRHNRRLAELLPFEPDDPLALIDEQRRRLLSEKPESPSSPSPFGEAGDALDVEKSGIPFTELTPAQQDRLRELGKQARIYSTGDGESGQRELTEDELRQVRLDGTVFVVLRVSGPGVRDAIIRPAYQAVSMSQIPEDLETMMAQAFAEGGGPGTNAIDDLKPEPFTPDAPVRALMVPVLTPGRLTQLADEMAKAGLNTLFYPALYGGYATFPAKSFPLDPALRGQDGLAAAMAAMKAKDIQVVAYLHTLAWQDQEDSVHWLSKYPGLVDVDVLGRSRLAWVKANPTEEFFRDGIRLPLRSYVTPRAPEVEARLDRFLDELSKQEGVSGVAFAEWAPLEADSDEAGNPILPPLGYTLPDRLAALRTGGPDPVDTPSGSMDNLPRSVLGWYGAMATPDAAFTSSQEGVRSGEDPYAPLMVRLLKQVKTANAKATTYLFDEPNGVSLGGDDEVDLSALPPGMPPPMGRPFRPAPKPEATPKPDVVLAYGGASGPGRGLWLRIPPRKPGWIEGEAEMPQVLREKVFAKLSALHLGLMVSDDVTEASGDGATGMLPTTARAPFIVLDFRLAPEEISDSLRWVRPPKAVKANKAGP